MRLLALAVLAVVFLSGCASEYVATQVTRYNAFDGVAPVGVTFSFKKSPASLEEASYAAQIANALAQFGWKQVSSGSGKYVVSFGWSVDHGTTYQSTSPILGTVGGGYSTTSGTITGPGGAASTYSGSTYTPPTLGVVGQNTSNETYYRRELQLVISKTGSLQQVFTGKVLSTGTRNSATQIMPFLVKALFHKFPGANGSVETYTVETDKNARVVGVVKEFR